MSMGLEAGSGFGADPDSSTVSVIPMVMGLEGRAGVKVQVEFGVEGVETERGREETGIG